LLKSELNGQKKAPVSASQPGLCSLVWKALFSPPSRTQIREGSAHRFSAAKRLKLTGGEQGASVHISAYEPDDIRPNERQRTQLYGFVAEKFHERATIRRRRAKSTAQVNVCSEKVNRVTGA